LGIRSSGKSRQHALTQVGSGKRFPSRLLKSHLITGFQPLLHLLLWILSGFLFTVF